MQVLMTEAAFERIRERLVPTLPDLDVVILDPSGELRRMAHSGAKVRIDPSVLCPEVVWISLDVYLSGLNQRPFIAELIMRGTGCRWVQSISAGLDDPMFRQFMGKGIRIAKSSAQAPAIAEYVIAHALSLFHPIEKQRTAQAARDWQKISFREIGGSKWLIVGFGSIGQEIARRGKALGVHLTCIRRNPGASALVEEIATQADLPRLLPDMDIVILACALNEETRGLADADFFASMKKDSIFINIARGALVDDDALKLALDADRPAHAVLDAFQQEPLPADSWFWSHPKVRVTAHTSYAGHGYQERSEILFLENFRRYRAGEPLLNEAHKSEVGL